MTVLGFEGSALSGQVMWCEPGLSGTHVTIHELHLAGMSFIHTRAVDCFSFLLTLIYPVHTCMHMWNLGEPLFLPCGFVRSNTGHQL